MKWRKLFRALHRDTGYIVAALTLAYVISGIAVNHIADWNPSYTFRDDRVNVGPLPKGDYKNMEQHVVTALGIDPKTVKGHFMETDSDFRVFLENSQEVRVNVNTGEGTRKRVVTRPLFYEVNALHLNQLKGIWTWIADLFALSLLLLVITGVFMMKGKRGIGGRGKWFVTAGTVIPVVFVLHLYLGCKQGVTAPPYSDHEPSFVMLGDSKLNRLSHIKGGHFSLVSHFRKTGSGFELCRIEVSGRYTQGKHQKRHYRLDVRGLPVNGLDKKRYGLGEGNAALAVHYDLGAEERWPFESGHIDIKTIRTQRSDKGLMVVRALGAVIDGKSGNEHYRGAFFLRYGFARVDGKCDVPPPEPVKLPDVN